MKLAIIPARDGSKRIPRKNVRTFAGKPMIAWSIIGALESGCFDNVIVSTDDEEIAEIARQYGATVPFVRPAALSDDYTGTTPVVQHAIEWCSEQGLPPEYVCCIYATAPFIDAEDIRRGLAVLEDTRCDYAFSVASYAFPIQRAVYITQQGRIEMFQPENFNTRSQDLEEAYHDAGQFYWGTRAAWLAGKQIFCSNSMPIILPRHRVQDIDTLEDWNRAEVMYKLLQKTRVS